MTEVIVVTSQSCHLCEDALEGLAELAEEFPASGARGRARVLRGGFPLREVPAADAAGRDPRRTPVQRGAVARKKLRRRLERAA